MLATLGIFTLLLAAPPAGAAPTTSTAPATAPTPVTKAATKAIPTAAATAPAKSEAPYQVLVCLRVSRNRVLTPLFVRSLRRQVQDQLANFFGSLSSVEVRTSGHWLLDDYADRPIDEPELTEAELSSRDVQGKVVLVGIDFRDGVYQVTSRHIEGQLQQASAVNSQATPDRQWVAKAVCLAVKDDFSPLATIVRRGTGGSVALDFQVGEQKSRFLNLLEPLSIWQPYLVVRGRGGALSRRELPYTLIRLDREHLGEPEVVSNVVNAFPQRAAVVGLEAAKLRTCTGRLRLHLLDDATGAPVINCSVAASDESFEALTDADLLEKPNREGYVASTREFQQMAYVKVIVGGNSAVKFPVPITSSWCEFEIRIPSDSKANEKNDFERILRALTQDLHFIGVFQSDAVRKFNELNSSKRYEEALSGINAHISSVANNLKVAETNLATLKRQAEELRIADNSSFDLASKQFTQHEKRHAEISELVTTLQSAIDTRDAQARANVLIKLAQQAEQECNIDEAITRYELALAEQPDQPTLVQKLAELKALWAVKSPERDLIFERWAKAELTEIATLLPQVELTLPKLKAAEDYLSLNKLLIVNTAQITEVGALVEQLAGRNSEADKQEASKYAELTEKLASFQEKVGTALEEVLASVAKSSSVETPAAADSPTTETPADEPSAPSTGAPPAVPPGKAAPPALPNTTEAEESPLKP
jgi:hypothetical protein